MSTVAEPTTPVATKPVAEMNADERLKHFGPPPEGMRYLRVGGNIIIDEGTKRPILAKKKATGKRNKPKKPVYAVPAGKLRSHETPGYDINSHARLKQADFADPLDFSKWDVWYYERRLADAKSAVLNMEALGSTPEERKERQDDARVIQAVERLTAKIKASPAGATKTALQERLGQLFASAMEG